MFRFLPDYFSAWLTRAGFCLLVALAVSVTVSFAQEITSGVIQGTIADENGAVVPGANVEARNIDTNFVRTFTTDDNGRFVFLQMPTGRYNVTVTKQGFAKLVQENLTLTVGQNVSLNLGLKVSGVEAQVVITSAPTVDTVKTESSSTLNDISVSKTPILGRKFEDFLTLTPGVSVVQGPDGDAINFAGQRGVFNNISLDGGDYNNGFFGEQAGGQRAAIDITLDAVQEFQVIATGANAEFGRTAGGVVNVITKSGTNEFHGSVFHYQRLEALTSNTSDGKPLTDFHREQTGGTIGGPIRRDKAFFFFAFEHLRETLTRANLSVQVGPTACPVQTPTITADEGLINSNADCQRLALLNFFRTRRNQEEGAPIERPIRNTALLGKVDWSITPANKLGVSYNFDYSKNTNQTFDVDTYGNSANGTEGPSKINVLNANLYSTISPTLVNEGHFTYSREERPRAAIPSNVPADTAAGDFRGILPTFRFGNPFFLQPNIDETFWRTQIRDNFSIVKGNHTIKFGGEWMHSVNTQVFRGFFTGRYIFGFLPFITTSVSGVTGFLRYASPAAPDGFGPDAVLCSGGTWKTGAANCPMGQTGTTPLLLYLQGAGRTGPATDAAGASDIDNEDYALFVQDKWQIWPNFTFNYGLRWEAQIFPDPVVNPRDTAYGIFLNDPRFPSDGTLPSDKKMFQPRIGFAWDISKKGKSVLRASYGIFNARQNMLSQVGSITTNGVQQQTIAGGLFANPTIRPIWPNVVTPTAGRCPDPPMPGVPLNPFPCFSGVRVFSRDYRNPRIYTTNIAFEQELASNLSIYFDFTHAKGVYLTRFLDFNSTGNSVRNGIFGPYLGEVFVASALGKSLYRGFTAGVRKRFSNKFQLEANYVLSKDRDDDSNERDPFTDRAFDLDNLQLDYALSDRDIRHKFNFFAYFELPWQFEFAPRIQARSAQPITPDVRTATNRNTLHKNNEYFSFDWRLARPFRFGERIELVPQIEMFNTFNTENNINPLITPGLFNFDGFLRQGVGDPRQVQLSIRLKF